MKQSHNNQKTIIVFPESNGEHTEIARCIMFYEWEQNFSSEWLATVEDIFEEFGTVPYEATGNLDKAHLQGNYKRVRKRLKSFLQSDSDNLEEPDIQIQSSPYNKSCDFFPCDIRVAWSTNISRQRQGMIAVRENLVENCNELFNRAGRKLLRSLGSAYVTVFNFPANFGPDYYLSSIGTIPKGRSSSENSEYKKRITHWRDNVWHLGLRAKQGYFREVYPINFVLETHLKKRFRDKLMSDYMSAVGRLEQSEYNKKIYRWDITLNHLETVRNELETSGLILSSSTVPI